MSATDPVTLPDLKFQAMRALGLTGAIPEMTLAWLQANGATSDSIPDAWNEMLATQLPLAGGVATGHRADDWYKLLELLGYATAGGRDINQINERERLFWGSGGVFGPSAPIWGSIGLMFAYESGQDIVIDLNNYCFANPEVTGYTSDTGTLSGGPPAHILTITWADLGSVEGITTVNLTATNAEGTTPWSFQAGAIAGAPSSKPQFDPVPNFYSTYGATGGTEQPAMYAQDGGLDMNDYLINPPVNPGSWVVSAPQYVTIDANTGIVTGRIDTPVGTWGTQAGATNEVGQGWSNIFQWQVLPVGGWAVDFTSVDPDTLGGLTYTSTSETFNDYQAQPQTVGPNVPAMVGQQWDDPGYTQRGVSYGIQIVATDTNVDGSFDTLAGVPDGGIANNYTMRQAFRISKSLADIWADNAGAWSYALEVFHNDDNLNAVQILQTSATQISARLKTDDNTNDRMLDFDVGAVPAGTLFDFRLRKSDTDDNGDNGWWGQCRVDGGAPIELSATIDCTAAHALGPLNRVSIGSPANNNPDRIPGDYQYIQIEASVLDKATITGWPTWTEPTPMLDPTLPVDPPFLHFGEGEGPGNGEVAIGVIFQTNFSNDTGYDWKTHPSAVAQDSPYMAYQPDIPEGFFLTDNKMGGQSGDKYYSRLHQVVTDPVHGNTALRVRPNDTTGDTSTRGFNSVLFLLLGTKYKGYNELYLRYNIRWPNNNNHLGGGNFSYRKWFRFNANAYIPDADEYAEWKSKDRGLQNVHSNALHSELILQDQGSANNRDRGWRLSTFSEDKQDKDYSTIYTDYNHTEGVFGGTWENMPGGTNADDSMLEVRDDVTPDRDRGDFVNDVNQEYHTVEFHIKAQSADRADDGVFEMWFDGELQVCESDEYAGFDDVPWSRQKAASASATQKPGGTEHTRPRIWPKGVGYNWVEILGNSAESTAGQVGEHLYADGKDGGFYLRDVVVSTKPITHDYQVSQFFHEQGRNAQMQCNPGDFELFNMYRGQLEFVVGTKPSKGVAQFGWMCYDSVTWEWFLKRDTPRAGEPVDGDGRVLLNGHAEWQVKWGAEFDAPGGSGVDNTSSGLHKRINLVDDDAGQISFEVTSGGVTKTNTIRLQIIADKSGWS